MQNKVSVIMPVHNGEKYLREAIDSILNQTFHDYEFIIIDDGSMDDSVDIIQSFNDSRIRLLRNTVNKGASVARNLGLMEARGEYIALLDADDISLSVRLEKQVKLLDSEPQIGLCGTWIKTIGTNEGVESHYPVNNDIIKCELIFTNPLATSSIMLRKQILQDNPCLMFNLNYSPVEDYDLWERVSQFTRITNIPEVLTLYRLHSDQTTSTDKGQNNVWEIQRRQIDMLKIWPSEIEKDIHLRIGVRQKYEGKIEAVEESEKWLIKLKRNNDKYNKFPELAFSEVIGKRWFLVCYSAAGGLGFMAWKKFRNSQLFNTCKLTLKQRIKFFIKCGLK